MVYPVKAQSTLICADCQCYSGRLARIGSTGHQCYSRNSPESIPPDRKQGFRLVPHVTSRCIKFLQKFVSLHPKFTLSSLVAGPSKYPLVGAPMNERKFNEGSAGSLRGLVPWAVKRRPPSPKCYGRLFLSAHSTSRSMVCRLHRDNCGNGCAKRRCSCRV